MEPWGCGELSPGPRCSPISDPAHQSPCVTWSDGIRVSGTQTGPGQSASVSVLVLGMHRSGTSALAGALHAAGISAGPLEGFMAARPENPRFFGERQAVADFNDRLLEALDWSWDSPAAAPSVRPPACDQLVAEGRQLVGSILSGTTRQLKDPRISLLLPWWRRMLLDRCVVVMPVRSPVEVAWSLSVRNGFPFELGLALWSAYHRHIASGLEGLPVVVVEYAALTVDPGSAVPAMLEALRALGIDGDLDYEAAVASIDPSLRRATQPTTAANSMVAVEALRTAEPWALGPVASFERFALSVEPAVGWEIAMLDLRRRAVLDGRVAATALRVAAEARQEAKVSRLTMEAALADLEQARTAQRAAEGEAERARAAAARLEAMKTVPDGDRTWALRTVRRSLPGWVVTSRGRAVVRVKVRRIVARLPVPGAIARPPNPLFEARWYIEQNPDVGAAGLDAYRHFRRFGITDGRDPNPWFHTAWYLEHNPDVRESGSDPLDHYLHHGAAEGRDPSPMFTTDWYLAQNPDVRASGMNPLVHYLRHGRSEGRPPRPAS